MLVIGGGATGTGVALDAASRGNGITQSLTSKMEVLHRFKCGSGRER